MKHTSRAHRVAFFGAATALALVFSYVDSRIPLSAVFPGVRLGLSNIMTVTLLYRYGKRDALLCTVLRVLLSWILFSGSAVHLLYSAAGAAFSLIVMLLLRRTGFFGTAGVSIAGGVSHNLAQIACAAALTGTVQLFGYFPMLLLTGTLSGAAVGALSAFLLSVIGKTAIKR